MTDQTKSEKEIVLKTIQRLIEAFGRHDSDAYFAAFSPHATFLFHNMDRLLTSRAEYEKEWKSWEDTEDFRVISCTSSFPNLQIVGSTAIFTHNVSTVVQLNSVEMTNKERETIVFSRDETGTWLAIHEHLSLAS